jgi:hypothetical protein
MAELTFIQKILPGVIALVLLAMLWGPLNFYPWLVESLIIYAGMFFLINVIIRTIINRNFEYKDLKPMIIGILAIIIAVILNKMTPIEILESMLEATAIWSLFYTIFMWVHEKVNNN